MFFKGCGDLRKEPADFEMLGAGFFAFAAFEAVGSLSSGFGIDYIVIIVLVPVVEDLLCVHAGKEVGNGNMLRAAFCAVAAGCAGYDVLGP